MNQLKIGSEKILQHIENLSNKIGLAESQRFWPHHLFHFTDITNAINILTDGYLYPRNRLKHAGKFSTDIACPDIIDNTPDKWKDFVRLYFRPRTPMLYRIEGFRPKGNLPLGAHCPVPIFFLFEAKKILTSKDTRFSNGNLAATGVEVDDSVEFYLKLPFNKIYHDVSLFQFSENDKNSIKFHRHAEIIVPEKLDLSALKLIYCRSRAEFETLIHLLPPEKWEQWKNKIGVARRNLLFFSQWVYVEKVNLDSSSIEFCFNPSRLSSPFHAEVSLTKIARNKLWSMVYPALNTEERLSVDISHLEHPNYYAVSLKLDGHIAYSSVYNKESENVF